MNELEITKKHIYSNDLNQKLGWDKITKVIVDDVELNVDYGSRFILFGETHKLVEYTVDELETIINRVGVGTAIQLMRNYPKTIKGMLE